jgi:hypothetical protein
MSALPRQTRLTDPLINGGKMSFRTAYYDFKRGRSSNYPKGYFRDPTPEEEKKLLDDYYKRSRKAVSNTCRRAY